MQAWLFTVIEDLDDLQPGSSFKIWSPPPYELESRRVRRRADGQPYTPAWREGDEIVVFHPSSQSCVATLRVDSNPEWVQDDEVFDLDTTVIASCSDGASLAEVGVLKAVQGGRQRLTPQQRAAARRRIARSSA